MATPTLTASQVRERIRQTLRGIDQKVVMLGLGRLQLGLVGPVFSELGFRLLGVSLGREALVRRLTSHGHYRVIDSPPHAGTDVEVEAAFHFDPENPDSEESKRAVAAAADAQIINCGLGVSPAFLRLASKFLLAVEVFRRHNAIIDTLHITCTDNPVGKTFSIDLVQRDLQAATFTLQEDHRIALWNDMAAHVRFLPTLADRICSKLVVPTDEKRPVYVVAEPFAELAFDRSFLGVQRLASRDSEAFGKIRLWDNLEFARLRKLYTLSMAHAIAAYSGAFDPTRPKTVADALRSRAVRSRVERALEEVTVALVAKTSGSESEWFDYTATVLRRISEDFLEDPIERVAREVPRKLTRDDRLLGPLLLVLRTSFRESTALLGAVLHALFYALAYEEPLDSEEPDNATVELGQRLRSGEVVAVLSEVCGLQDADPAEEYIMGRLHKEYNGLLGQGEI